jgi:hypothetical protein
MGMSDLDANGNWYNVPGQGYVWSPYDAQAVGVSFDPYGYGHWVNYPGRGYVWVSGYDWGYAPFQCGLWNYYDNFGWGWAPGGGCNPWWGLNGFGGGGWGYNIGRPPRGYLPPRRPIPIPGRPHPIGGGGHELHAAVPVDRRPPNAVNMALYAHPTKPVTIGGHIVEPLRPVAPREVYDRPSGLVARQPGGYYPSPTHPAGGVAGGVGGGVYVPHPSSGYHPPSTGYSGTYSGHTQSSASSGGSHASYSGGGGSSGGGGGGHASSGGGGGGGGGTHK